MSQVIIYFSLSFLKAHEKTVHTVFDTRKDIQGLYVYQVYYQNK